jgi:hypothetical protein
MKNLLKNWYFYKRFKRYPKIPPNLPLSKEELPNLGGFPSLTQEGKGIFWLNFLIPYLKERFSLFE